MDYSKDAGRRPSIRFIFNVSVSEENLNKLKCETQYSNLLIYRGVVLLIKLCFLTQIQKKISGFEKTTFSNYFIMLLLVLKNIVLNLYLVSIFFTIKSIHI